MAFILEFQNVIEIETPSLTLRHLVFWFDLQGVGVVVMLNALMVWRGC